MTLVSVIIGIVGRDWYWQRQRSAAVELITDLKGSIAYVPTNQIDRIYLQGKQITNEALARLVYHLRYIPELRELDLTFTSVNDGGLMEITALHQLKVVVVHESPVTDDGIRKFQSMAPQLTVKRERPDPVATGLAMRPVFRHAVVALAWDPQEKWFATGSGDGTLSVWSSGGELLRTVAAHQKWLFSVAVNPTGRLLATGGGDHAIRIWDVETLEQQAELIGHTDDVHAVAFSPDRQVLVSPVTIARSVSGI